MSFIKFIEKIKYAFIYKYVVHFPYYKVRVYGLRSLGYSVGEGTYFSEDLVITMGYLNRGKLVLGERVSIGPRCILVVIAHPNNSVLGKNFVQKERKKPIGSDVWLGAGVIVLPEITIGEGSIIGAGSIVTKNIPPYSVAVGNPARVIKKVGE